jgi:hypothetical protein
MWALQDNFEFTGRIMIDMSTNEKSKIFQFEVIENT